MALVSNMVLRSPIEHVPSEVNEIRSIQVSFLKMKYGLGSFAKYVPYEVVRQMMSKGEEAVLGVTPKEVTIFFSDIAGFTTICEAMKPNELLVLLSDYFAAMSAIIVKGRGWTRITAPFARIWKDALSKALATLLNGSTVPYTTMQLPTMR